MLRIRPLMASSLIASVVFAMPVDASTYAPTASDPYNFDSTGMLDMLTSYFTDMFDTYTSAIESEIHEALGIDLPQGALGVLIQDQLAKNIPSIAAKDGGANPVAVQQIQEIEAERASAEGLLNAQLSADRQQQQVENQESIAQAVQAAQDAADTAYAAQQCAQDATATQEVLKCISTILSLQNDQFVALGTILQANYDNAQEEKIGGYQQVTTLQAIRHLLAQQDWEKQIDSTISSIGSNNVGGFFAGVAQGGQR